MSGKARSSRFVRTILFTIGPIGLLAVGGYYYAAAGRYVTTENAFVKFDILEISADVSGRVVTVDVAENERVEEGQILFRIDPEPFAIELSSAEAEMAAVRNKIEALRAEYRRAQLELDEAGQSIRYLLREYERQKRLRAKGVASAAKFDEAEFNLVTARQREQAVHERANMILAEIGGNIESPVEDHPLFRQAMARRDRARLDLRDASVQAPSAGIVSNVRMQTGEYVTAATPVFSLIRATAPWIEANLKETQLTYVRTGLAATVVVSTYPDLVWQARVESISPATGAEYALLPPQNATGNWVKVVQRVPVRLLIERSPSHPPLRSGMTATVSIDTQRESGLIGWMRSALARSDHAE